MPDLSILFVFVWISQHAVVFGDNQGTTSNDTLTSEMIRESRFPDGFGEAIRILKRMYIQYKNDDALVHAKISPFGELFSV